MAQRDISRPQNPIPVNLIGGPFDGSGTHVNRLDKQLRLPIDPKQMQWFSEAPTANAPTEETADWIKRTPEPRTAEDVERVAVYEQQGDSNSTTYRFLEYEPGHGGPH